MTDSTLYELDSGEAWESFDSSLYPPAKSAFGYFGSKQKLTAQILKSLPPHHCWVDLFCGSAAVTLAKRAVPLEIINDLDGDIVNVFEQLRDHGSELMSQIVFTPYSRQEHLSARDSNAICSDLERARKFLVRTMMSVNGVIGGSAGGFSYSNSYTRNQKEARVNRWQNYNERLLGVAERLRDCRIENYNAINLLKKFSRRPATLIYIDPPYLTKRGGGYVNDANNEKFHSELLELCNKSQCMIVISGYESPVYTEHLDKKKGWQKTTIPTHTTATTGQKFLRNEILWTNKSAQKALKNQRVPIRLTKKEAQQGKINPLRP